MPRTKEAFGEIRDARRRNIVTAAVRVFAQKGLAGTKISDLSKAAGMSQGLLYHYFADKGEVFAEVLGQVVREAIELAEVSRFREGDAMERLTWLTNRLLENLWNRDLRRIAEQAPGLPGAGMQQMRKMGKALFAAVRALIVEGQESGVAVPGDSDELAILYFSCLQGLASTIDLFDEPMRSHFPGADAMLRFLRA